MLSKFDLDFAQLLLNLSFVLDPATIHKIEMLVGDDMVKRRELKKIMTSIQTSIDDARLAMKYLQFDSEIIQRENEALRDLLEEGEEP